MHVSFLLEPRSREWAGGETAVPPEEKIQLSEGKEAPLLGILSEY